MRNVTGLWQGVVSVAQPVPRARGSSPLTPERRCKSRVSASPHELDLSDAEHLALRLMHLGPQSRMALKMALLAFETEGGSGVLTVTIPKNPKDHPDLSFTTTQ